jgi:DNA-binding MarR family transcriptional regulator
MDRTTLTAALKPLQRGGYVEVTIDPADRRSRRLTLTRPGKSLLASAVPIWKRTHADVEGLLDSDNADRLRRELQVLS